MRNLHGFTLVEVLISIACLGMASLAVMQMLQIQRTRYSQEDKREIIHALLEDNIAEINTKDISVIPTSAECLVRRYSASGDFEQETKFLATDPNCTNHIPDQIGIKIVWEVKESDAIKVSFDPSASLKLPKYVSTVRQVQLFGALRATAGDPMNPEYSVTVYKRGK